MGLHIECKFGPKKRGGFRVPVHFLAQADEQEFNPHFQINKKYSLSEKIFGGKGGAVEKNGGIACIYADHLILDVNCYGSLKIAVFNLFGCCGCSNCQVYLPWRPGAHPDYSDFEQVFQQIANDIRAMYENAVAEALASEEIAQYDVVVFDSSQETILSQKFQEDVRTKPQRKLRV